MARALPLLLGLWLFAVSASAADPLVVSRVVDGDTLLLSDGRRVRLIGVDTPEVHPSAKLNRDAGGSKRRAEAIRELGRRSSKFVTALVEGKMVTLRFDDGNRANGHRDRYGRTLAYIHFEPSPCDELELWVADDACDADAYETGFLNAVIIEAGYASAYTRFPFRHLEEFRRLEAEARRNNRGLWRPEPRDAFAPAGARSASANNQETAGPQNLSWALP